MNVPRTASLRNERPCLFLNIGDVSKVGYFLDIVISIADSEFKIKSLYSNDLILNIASKSKETVQKLFRNPL